MYYTTRLFALPDPLLTSIIRHRKIAVSKTRLAGPCELSVGGASDQSNTGGNLFAHHGGNPWEHGKRCHQEIGGMPNAAHAGCDLAESGRYTAWCTFLDIQPLITASPARIGRADKPDGARRRMVVGTLGPGISTLRGRPSQNVGPEEPLLR